MTAKIEKRYIRVGRDQCQLLAETRDFVRELGMTRVYAEFHEAGGQSGDLLSETAELEIYTIREVGTVWIYSLVDDNTSGFALSLSVLAQLRPHEFLKISEKLPEFLDERGFVTRYSSFKERPYSFHSFQDFLDEPYQQAPGRAPFTVPVRAKT